MKATLYYQSIPPYYLMQRFEQAPNAAATQRLLYLTSRLDTTGTPIENWKLLIASSPAVAPGALDKAGKGQIPPANAYIAGSEGVRPGMR